MLFHTWQFFILFLPISLFIYRCTVSFADHSSEQRPLSLRNTFLLALSLFFYAYWKWTDCIILLCSIGFNFLFGEKIKQNSFHTARVWFCLGLSFNLAFLIYFKYFNFFLDNLNWALGSQINWIKVILPIGISFFTFQQIAYLVDCKRGDKSQYGFVDYALFVSFFPQLIAGPIAHHKEIMPQLNNRVSSNEFWANLSCGLTIFSIGLFKKVILADTLAVYVDLGFSHTSHLSMGHAWLTSLCYTFQLYYDFSGYTDMAMGIAKMFGVNLPFNFNSPYQACSIQEFWQKWHITLGRFLCEYVYIPMGGSRGSLNRTIVNMVSVFLIGGLWHGADWTFVIWGAMHGIAMAIQQYWQSLNYVISRWFGWLLTFMFVNISWVVFRAEKFDDALNIWATMFNLKSHGNVVLFQPIILYFILPAIVVFLYYLLKKKTTCRDVWMSLGIQNFAKSIISFPRINKIIINLFLVGIVGVFLATINTQHITRFYHDFCSWLYNPGEGLIQWLFFVRRGGWMMFFILSVLSCHLFFASNSNSILNTFELKLRWLVIVGVVSLLYNIFTFYFGSHNVFIYFQF